MIICCLCVPGGGIDKYSVCIVTCIICNISWRYCIKVAVFAFIAAAVVITYNDGCYMHFLSQTAYSVHVKQSPWNTCVSEVQLLFPVMFLLLMYGKYQWFSVAVLRWSRGCNCIPRFWLCTPGLAWCNKNRHCGQCYFVVSIETLENQKFQICLHCNW